MLVTDEGFTKEVARGVGSVCKEILPPLLASAVAAERFGGVGYGADNLIIVSGAIEQIRVSAEDFLDAGESDLKGVLRSVARADLAPRSEQRYLAFVSRASQATHGAPVLAVVEVAVDHDRPVRFVGLTFHGDGQDQDSFAAAIEQALGADDEYGDGAKVARIFDIPEAYLSFVYVEDLEDHGYRVYKVDKCCDGSKEPRLVNLEEAREAVERVLNLRRESGEPEGRSGSAGLE